MSDEFVQDQPVEGIATADAPTEQVVVEGLPLQKNELDPKSFASSDLPYHTKETEDIAVSRAKELEGQDKKPYEYKFNGYTVTEVEVATTEEATQYKVTADDAAGFEQFFTNQRAAEIFVETHSPQFAKNATVTSKIAVQDAPKT